MSAVGCDGACTSMYGNLQCVLPNGHKGDHENQRIGLTSMPTERTRWANAADPERSNR